MANIDIHGPEQLVQANHILFQYGVVDGFGHVSMRCTDNPEHFWLSKNRAPALVKVSDLLKFDLTGEPVETTSETLYLERYIHASLYRARLDVNAVVHSHSHTIVPFSISAKTKLKPVWHMAGFLESDVPVFDTADKFGDGTDLLISSLEMADAMSDCIANNNVVLMRGHGATIVGRDLPEAVYRAIYSELNARIQLQGIALGEIKSLSKGEAIATVERISPQIKRAWDLWCAEIKD
jgi:ribulose-5-phosphate 4-epimerase/fuculose-1-phosphate aldolase